MSKVDSASSSTMDRRSARWLSIAVSNAGLKCTGAMRPKGGRLNGWDDQDWRRGLPEARVDAAAHDAELVAVSLRAGFKGVGWKAEEERDADDEAKLVAMR